MIRGFRDFIMRGNVVDLAVAVVIGAAFGSIVSAFSDRVVKPLIAAAGGSESMNGLGFSIRNGNPEIAKTTFVDIGSVISAFINF
jgi:large conductance mechanosensitive channel